jgi:divalent metal cation (Fe/Co/Zn/Cd) transporter
LCRSCLHDQGGVRFRKELLGTVIILALMFATSASVGYESVMKIVKAAYDPLPPISNPYLVMEVASASAGVEEALSLYLRFAKRRKGSLALISQPVDVRNSVYIALAVLACAACIAAGTIR